MNDLVELALTWCRQLPKAFVQELADAARTGPDACSRLMRSASGPESRAAAQRARQVARDGDGPYLAGLVDGYRTGSRDVADVQPVWTGPTSSVAGARLTVAVINDLIATATHELLLVSYAAYPPADLSAALRAAADRGVEVTMLLERPEDEDNPSWDGPSSAFSNLQVTRLSWPASARPPSASMHAKVLVVDRQVALVGSANLTAAAFGRNLECGLLVRGGSVPARIAEHVLSAEGLRRL